MPERSGDFKVSAGERQVVRALGSIGSATLLSRVLGFARDVLVARAFGAGPSTDAFFVAFRIPNILRRLPPPGAPSPAVIPPFPQDLVPPPILARALGVLAGGVGQLLVQLPDLRRLGLLVPPSGELRHPALPRIGRLLVP